jgi:hypothetical protein
MTTVWRTTALLLVGSLVLVAAGFWRVATARAEARQPRELLATQKVMSRMGGSAGLAARERALGGVLARLELERTARGADAGAFSRRLEDILGELGLSVASSSGWKAVPGFKVEGAAAFERTFAGTGGFADLLGAVRTIESWPDQARVRSFTVTPGARGQVAWQLEVSLVRLVPGEAGRP